MKLLKQLLEMAGPMRPRPRITLQAMLQRAENDIQDDLDSAMIEDEDDLESWAEHVLGTMEADDAEWIPLYVRNPRFRQAVQRIIQDLYDEVEEYLEERDDDDD